MSFCVLNDYWLIDWLIRITNRIEPIQIVESIRIANWNARVSTGWPVVVAGWMAGGRGARDGAVWPTQRGRSRRTRRLRAAAVAGKATVGRRESRAGTRRWIGADAAEGPADLPPTRSRQSFSPPRYEPAPTPAAVHNICNFISPSYVVAQHKWKKISKHKWNKRNK